MSSEELRFDVETETVSNQKSFIRILPKHRSITKTLIITVLFILLVIFIFLFIFKSTSCSSIHPTTTSPFGTSAPSEPTVDALSSVWPHLRLPRSLIPSSYSIHLTIDLSEFIFIGNTSIHVKASSDMKLDDHVILHAVNLGISPHNVALQQITPTNKIIQISQCNYSIYNEFYVIKLHNHVIKPGNEYILSFKNVYGMISDDLKGLYRSSYRTTDGEIRYLALTQLQSIDARRVYPSFDEPDMKAVFNITITHQSEYTALSNMEDIETTVSDGWTTVKFATTPRMATYLVAILVSDFTYNSTVNKQGLKIRVWTRKDMESQRSYALDVISKTYEFFAEYFDKPEILNKTDHAAVPDFGAGAMENWGLVLYRETSLLYNPDSYSFHKKILCFSIMAHEIAHSWFGNMATMKWWDDLWLNEGFANTLMYLPINHFHEDWKVFDSQLVNNIFPVMITDSRNTSKALSTAIMHQDNITTSFDLISYDKGMAVLRMLYGFLGFTNFRDGLREYVKQFSFSNANITQLWDIFDNRSSNLTHKVKDVLATWANQMGFPIVTVSQIRPGRYKLEQQKCTLSHGDVYDVNTSPYGYKWIIPFTYLVEGSNKVHTKWMNMTSAEIDVEEGKWLIGNVDAMGMYRVNYDLDMWKKIIHLLKTNHEAISAASRAALVDNVFNLARSGHLSYSIAFELSTYLKKENAHAPWGTFYHSMNFITEMMSQSDSYGKLKKLLRELVEEKYMQINSTYNRDPNIYNLKHMLFSLGLEMGAQNMTSWARDKFNDWMTNNKKLPNNHTEEILKVGVRAGGEVVWDYMWNLTTNSLLASDTEMYYGALAYTNEQWLMWRFVRMTLRSDLIKSQDVATVYSSLLRSPMGREVVLSFMIIHWTTICKKFETDAYMLKDIISTSMRFVNNQYHYQQLIDLYDKHPPPGVVSTVFRDSLSLIRSNINWMERNHDSIEEWLNNNIM